MSFKPPHYSDALRAIGNTGGLPVALQRAFDPEGDFSLIPAPKPGDWLAEHSEVGQSYDDFAFLKAAKPSALRDTIYLQPLGQFWGYQAVSLDALKECGADYFAMNLKVLPPLPLSEAGFTTRMNPVSGNLQILTHDILAHLMRHRPADAFCVLAITMEDLYPDPSWNFVFGQASMIKRVGVFSFARYDPAFYGEIRGEGCQVTLLRRCCKVLVHETGHLFSLPHCIFFRCVMNGSNHLVESDARPLSLCPVCLRKLQLSIGFDVAHRYRDLLRFYQRVGFEAEAMLTSRRLKKIAGENGQI